MIPPADRTTAVTAPVPLRPMRWLGWGICATLTIAALTTFAQKAAVPQPEPPRAPSDAAPVPAFVPAASLSARPAVPVSMSGPRFRWDETDPLDPVRAEPPRLDPSTGRREDTLSQGDFGVIEGPYLRLTVAEGPESGHPRNLFVTLARRGADGLGLSILRTGERGRVETKFGPLDTLDVTLGGPVTRICTGFMTLDASAVRLDGWLCAPLGQPPEPHAITCAVDKLVLTGPASSDVEALARAAETRRDRRCAPAATASVGEVEGATGSIEKRHARKIKAELRRSAQAQP